LDSEEDESRQYERVLVPRQLVQSDDSGSFVWLADPDGNARRQSVELGKAGTEKLVEAVRGIRPTDKLISSGWQALEPGDRVRIVGEDDTMGLDASEA
jgi:membrane fusion protein (multidrug efflux system)